MTELTVAREGGRVVKRIKPVPMKIKALQLYSCLIVSDDHHGMYNTVISMSFILIMGNVLYTVCTARRTTMYN
jgi:hypothetical protein